jgi:hypothetical protein
VEIDASGETTVGTLRAATPSQWFENIKSFFKLRETGQSPDVAYDLVCRSEAQLTGNGATPTRVPDVSRNTPKSLQSGQLLSLEMPLGEVASHLPPPAKAASFVESPGFKAGVSATGEALQHTGKVLSVYAALKSAENVTNAIGRDIKQGTGGEQTARTVAHEAAGWAGALAGAEEGAALGLICGPAAEVCSPLGALALGLVGYYASAGSVDSILLFATGR